MFISDLSYSSVSVMARRSNRTPNEAEGLGQGEAFEMEQQNNRHLDSLASKVSMLHSVSLNIHDDVNDQNRLLDNTSETFNRFGNMFDRTRQTLTHTMATAGSRFMCYLTLILVFGVFSLYYIAVNLLSRESEPPELT
ncbi:hypothetical protein H4S07_005002 [Coemansia furcata]|uniref:Uncharacterized protein n=1 Tax=Coemansia furcata TaxID=417177 RepID=A0ACC1L4E1_9FUNG|nr:hypothetical protein H4S07_005002 [Coemansia furcata]